MEEKTIERVAICPECQEPVDMVIYPDRAEAECFACGWFEPYPIEQPD